VTYSDNKSYYFAPPPLSAGRQDDVIVMPNLPLLGALRKLSASPLALSMFESMLRSHGFGRDKAPFLAVSVREFMWGYPSLIMSIERAQVYSVHLAGFGRFESLIRIPDKNFQNPQYSHVHKML
jgi:hypothetical protein